MKDPLITKNGQINMKKALLYAILFSLTISFFVKWIDESHPIITRSTPYLIIVVIASAFIQVFMLVGKEVKKIYSLICRFKIWITTKLQPQQNYSKNHTTDVYYTKIQKFNHASRLSCVLRC
jgi:Na+-translocating ferredoxin:NAD+ oxidoreductase RnfA subunit